MTEIEATLKGEFIIRVPEPITITRAGLTTTATSKISAGSLIFIHPESDSRVIDQEASTSLLIKMRISTRLMLPTLLLPLETTSLLNRVISQIANSYPY